MRWMTVFAAATACFFAILVLYEVTLNRTPLMHVLDPRFVVSQFGASAIMLAVSGAIFVLPLWLVLGKHMRDRPGPWAVAGAFGGSAMMLFAAVYAATCKSGTQLCPADLQAQTGSFLVLAAVTGIAGAAAAHAGLVAGRRPPPPAPGARPAVGR